MLKVHEEQLVWRPQSTRTSTRSVMAGVEGGEWLYTRPV